MITRARDDIMGMPITITVVDRAATEKDIQDVFTFFQGIDNRFSPFKKDSEVSKINRHEISGKNVSDAMREVLSLADQTLMQTNGYFDVKKNDGTIDPSGIVKGWAIHKAAAILLGKGFYNFFIEAGGDIQTQGKNAQGDNWRVGIKNPFNRKQLVQVLSLSGQGIATSGTYEKGQHVYNPHGRGKPLQDIVSVTVIGPNIYDADRFATAALAMQNNGIHFIEQQNNLEGYMIDKAGVATMTSHFQQYAYRT